jgi:hypothetical protein
MTNSERNVPITARTPTSSGSEAADQPPEHDDQQQQRDRDRDQLGPPEIALDGGTDVVEDRVASADLDAELVEVADDRSDRAERLLRGGLVGGRIDEHQRRAGVVAPQRRWGAELPVRRDRLDALDGTQCGDELGRCVRRAPAVGVAVDAAHHEDHLGLTGDARIVEQLLGAHAVGARIVEPAVLQHAERATAEGAGDHDEHEGEREHPAAPTDREVTE